MKSFNGTYLTANVDLDGWRRFRDTIIKVDLSDDSSCLGLTPDPLTDEVPQDSDSIYCYESEDPENEPWAFYLEGKIYLLLPDNSGWVEFVDYIEEVCGENKLGIEWNIEELIQN